MCYPVACVCLEQTKSWRAGPCAEVFFTTCVCCRGPRAAAMATTGVSGPSMEEEVEASSCGGCVTCPGSLQLCEGQGLGEGRAGLLSVEHKESGGS